MTILGLILKIILWILVGLVGCLVILVLGILFLPIIYEMEVAKWDTLRGKIKLNVFYILKIHYDLSVPDTVEIKLFGFKLNLDSKKQAKQVKKDVPKSSKQNNTKSEVVTHSLSNKKENVVAEQNKPQNQQIKKSTNKVAPKVTKEEQKNKKKKKRVEQSGKSLGPHEIWVRVKELWQDESRKPFFKACQRLLIRWWHALKPKTLYFQVVFGLEDPAETGMWLAKLMAFYPLYAPYGQIQGNFNEALVQGSVQINGKIRLIKFLYPILGFIKNKEVRIMIKKIMHFGKDD